MNLVCEYPKRYSKIKLIVAYLPVRSAKTVNLPQCDSSSPKGQSYLRSQRIRNGMQYDDGHFNVQGGQVNDSEKNRLH